jgi:hypothetical protein
MLLRNRHSPWLRIAFMLGAIGLFLFGYQWGNQYKSKDAQPPVINGVLVRPPATVPGFRLLDPRGRVFDQDTLAAGWTLLTFGDLSGAQGQLAVQRLIDVYNRIGGDADLQRALRLVLVTTTDAPNLARDFSRLSPALSILAGDAGETERLRAALGTGEDADPLVFVFAPGGYLIALLTNDEDGSAMAADLGALYADVHMLLPESP